MNKLMQWLDAPKSPVELAANSFSKWKSETLSDDTNVPSLCYINDDKWYINEYTDTEYHVATFQLAQTLLRDATDDEQLIYRHFTNLIDSLRN